MRGEGEEIAANIYRPVVEGREDQSCRHFRVGELEEEGEGGGRRGGGGGSGGESFAGHLSALPKRQDLRIALDEGRGEGNIGKETGSVAVTSGGFTCQESNGFLDSTALDETMKRVVAGGAQGVSSGGEESQNSQRFLWLGEGGASPAHAPPTTTTSDGRSGSGCGEVPRKNGVKVCESRLQEVLHGFVSDELNQDVLQVSLPGGEGGGERGVVVVGGPPGERRLYATPHCKHRHRSSTAVFSLFSL